MKRYTKRQIQEAIAYWKKQLRRLDESTDADADCECEATLKIRYNGANGYTAADAMFDALCRKFGGEPANDSGAGRLEIAVEGGSSSDEAEKGYDFIGQLNALIQHGHV